MYSASLLFVYEGDGEVLQKGLEMEEQTRQNQRQTNSGEEEDDVDDDDDGDADDDENGGPYISVVKLIDFAHAEWVPGQGPDENMLQGVRSILDILKDFTPT